MHRERLKKTHQIVLGCALGLTFILGVEAILAIDDGVQIRLFDIDSKDRWSMSLRDGRDRIKIKSRGPVELVEDIDGPRLHLGDGAVVRINAKEGGERRQLEAQGRNGETHYEFRVDGKSHEFGVDGEEWLRAIVLDAVRRGGFDANARALRLYREGGIEALQQELPQIQGEDTRRRYLTAVLDDDSIPAADLAAVLGSAEKHLKSDHAVTGLLESVSPIRLRDADVAEAFFGVVRSTSNDHSKARMLSHVLDPAIGDSWTGFFEAAATIGADHVAADLAVDYAGLGHAELPDGLIPFIERIDADHQQRRVIETLLEGPLGVDAREALIFAAATGISADHEAANLLTHYASTGRGVTPGALLLLRSIGGDSHQSRAVEALMASTDAAELPAILRATSIESDHLLSQILIFAAEHSQDGGSEELRATVEAAAASIGADFPRRQVREAWGLDA